jgi:hypothetical protein
VTGVFSTSEKNGLSRFEFYDLVDFSFPYPATNPNLGKWLEAPKRNFFWLVAV